MLVRPTFAGLTLLLCALAACAPEPGPVADDHGVLDDDDVAADDDDDTVDDTDHATLSGTVVDPDGAPLADLPMTMCGQFCVFATSDADGNFLFERAPEGASVLENLAAPDLDEAHWSKFFEIVSVEAGADVELPEHVVVPTIADPTFDPAGPQDLELDGGLRVAFDADDVELPFTSEVLSVGAVEVPADRLPTGGLGDWTVVRGWALAVWELEQEDGFAVTAPLLEPLPDGTEVVFLVADYNHGVSTGEFFVEDAELSVDGLSVSTPPTRGLDRLTLVLAAALQD